MKRPTSPSSLRERLRIFLLLFVLAGGLHAQTILTSPPNVLTFQRSYTQSYQEIVYGMTQTADSGYVFAGQLYSTSLPFIFDSYVQKVDKWGNIAWANGYGQGGFNVGAPGQHSPDERRRLHRRRLGRRRHVRAQARRIRQPELGEKHRRLFRNGLR